jgi:hypothetical protein
LKKISLLLVITLLVFVPIIWFTGFFPRLAWHLPDSKVQTSPDREPSVQKDFLSACSECHSKNPALVRMHEVNRGRDCFECHQQNENFIAQRNNRPNSKQLKKRQQLEEPCKSCHSTKKPQTAKRSKKIFGRYYCSQCEHQVPAEATNCSQCQGTIKKEGTKLICSKCGQLINVSEIAKLSQRRPSNQICQRCHRRNKKWLALHETKFGTNRYVQTRDCLKCHQGHNQCGGCHF